MSHRVLDEVVAREMEEIGSGPPSRHHGSLPYIHKVEAPPKKNFLAEFNESFTETFFSDNPLGHFKDQSGSRKIFLGLQAIFPILEWGRSYNLRKFRGDLVSGLTIASLCIPQVSRSQPIFLPLSLDDQTS